MTKEQEFRKQTEEAKFEAFSLMCKKVAELENENAELKDDNKVMSDNYSKMEQKFYDNLTKAKELLKSIIDTPTHNQTGGEMYENKEYKELIAEAEQFLRETDIDNAIQ